MVKYENVSILTMFYTKQKSYDLYYCEYLPLMVIIILKTFVPNLANYLKGNVI